MSTATNTLNEILASELASARKGTFTGFIGRLEGVERGPKGNKTRFGDDMIHAVVVTGFKYDDLCRRSANRLEAMSDMDLDYAARGLTGWVRVWTKSAKVGDLAAICRDRGLPDTGSKADLVARLEANCPGGMEQVPVTRAHFDEAREALLDSLRSSEAGTNTSTTDDVYEPLVVNGETVRGARVYVGNPNGEDAADPGTIYLSGLMIGRKVLDPAPNGPKPASKSAPVSVAKSALRKTLPIGRYVSFKLSPGDWVVNVGSAAAAAADKDGVSVDPAKVAEVKDLGGSMTTPIPDRLAVLPWYAPHQAWLRDMGLQHHDPAMQSRRGPA